jgi:hypothetical protein
MNIIFINARSNFPLKKKKEEENQPIEAWSLCF